MCQWSLWEANDVCVVGGWDDLQFCTFDLHTELINSQLMTCLPLQECPLSQKRASLRARVAAATSHRPNDQQMSRSLPQPPDISRKTVKTVPLKLSKYLEKNAFYNYENSLLDSAWIPVQEHVILLTVRDQLSRIFDTEDGDTLSPCTNI